MMSWKPGTHANTRTIGQQAWTMHDLFPQFQYRRRGSRLVWTGFLKPSLKSPEYQVRIQYQQGFPPKVHVLWPEICPDAPHIYQSDKSLCLYYSKDGSWSSARLIARTVIPWTAEWLRFYEIWCITGKWFGPEAPHSGTK
jgi:hypothetical protein